MGEAEVTAVGDGRTWCLLPAQAVVPVRDVVAFLRPDHPEDHGNLASCKRRVHAVPRYWRLQAPCGLRGAVCSHPRALPLLKTRSSPEEPP